MTRYTNHTRKDEIMSYTVTDEIDLLTRKDLASILLSRGPGAALIVYEDKHEGYVLFQNFYPESDSMYSKVPELLRYLADRFEGAEFVPAETPEGEQ